MGLMFFISVMFNIAESIKSVFASDNNYATNKECAEQHPEPRRDQSDGKIIIENCLLYDEDVKSYGAYQAHQWAKQGKYNLSPDELKKERDRVNKELKYLYSLL